MITSSLTEHNHIIPTIILSILYIESAFWADLLFKVYKVMMPPQIC